MFKSAFLPDGTKRMFIESDYFIDCGKTVDGKPMFSVFRGDPAGVVSFIDSSETLVGALRMIYDPHVHQPCNPQLRLF